MNKQSKSTIIILEMLRKKTLTEVKFAKKFFWRIRSLISGFKRQDRIGKENAAFVQPPEKSVGKLPRNIKIDSTAKRNKNIIFSQPEIDYSTKKIYDKEYKK